MKRRPGPPTKFMLMLVALLVAGAIVNVAVAWGFSLAVTPPSEPFQFGHTSSQDGPTWQYTEACRLGLTALWWSPEFDSWRTSDYVSTAVRLSGPPAWTTVSWREPPGRVLLEAGFAAIIEHASGWPARAMMRRNDVWIGIREGKPTIDSASQWACVLVTPNVSPANSVAEMQKEYRALPLRPLWPGFAINTVFYAAILWGLFAAPFALRRLRGGRRIKRGLCPKCAYPVGVSANCTECGTSVGPGTAR